MNRRSILTKTGKGLMEATGKTSNLSRDLRNILKEIDGKVSVNELLEKFDKLTEQKLLELLSSMEKDGYVREFIGKQDEGPRTPVGRASGPPSLGDGSDLDFTAFTPAKPNAKASEDARLQAQAQEIARQAQATPRARSATSAKTASTFAAIPSASRGAFERRGLRSFWRWPAGSGRRSRPSPYRWRWCVAIARSSSSTSPPGWWCIPGQATRGTRCRTRCWRSIRSSRWYHAPDWCTASTRTRAG